MKGSAKKNKGQFAKKSEKPASDIITEFDKEGEIHDYEKVTDKPADKAPAKSKKDAPAYAETLKARPDLEAVYVAKNGDFFFSKSRADKNFQDGYKKVKNPHFEAPESVESGSDESGE